MKTNPKASIIHVVDSIMEDFGNNVIGAKSINRRLGKVLKVYEDGLSRLFDRIEALEQENKVLRTRIAEVQYDICPEELKK